MYAIDSELNIRHFQPAKGTTPGEDEKWFSTKAELGAIATSKDSLTAVWNSLAEGAPPFGHLKKLKQFKSTGEGLTRLWSELQRLDPTYVVVPDEASSEPQDDTSSGEVERLDESGVPTIQNEGDRPVKKPKKSAKAKAAKLASKPKTPKARKPKAGAKKQPTPGKSAKKEMGGAALDRVAELLRRKKGASIAEIMQEMGYSATHSARGRVSNLRSNGMKIESFKDDKRGRCYRSA